MLNKGIYEQVINKLISLQIEDESYIAKTQKIDREEASKILSKYVSEIVEKELTCIKDKGGDLQSQIRLCNKIIKTLTAATDDHKYEEISVDPRAELLFALIDNNNSIHAINSKAKVIRPTTSIAQSSLFTGAIHEPSMFSEFKKEILSCDRIDMLVSFIKYSGLRLIIDELSEFTRTRTLRVITTSYMGATDVKAIEALSKLPNTEIRISYDTKRTRLHAKAYVFYRKSGFTTAYIGSSNLTNVAISSGLEWNVKVTAKDLPDTLNKIQATFESYWNEKEFVLYSETEKDVLEKALRAERTTSHEKTSFNFDINPYAYQKEILDKLKAEREVHNNWRNLVVAATGTGKTVISAFDYKRFCNENKNLPCRLLFVAHREEILKQSVECFRAVIKNPNFGELFVGKSVPNSIDHLFISIQTFNSKAFDESTSRDFYDFIIIDEFHHTAAPTYQKLLSHYNPRILLGLTATPERMDGKDVIEYFGDRITAEIRLPEAIERKLLCPFQYFGVTDSIDLNTLKWTRGGYDKRELSNVYTMNYITAKKRVNMVIEAINKYVTDIYDVKGIGFCVSIEHTEFMASMFNANNIPSINLTSSSSDEERNTAKNRLKNGEIRFIFVVDLYNEGVDIPEVNTILFLRPTESLTVFLQQLGRGLRISDNKECLTALDFIGQANRKYNFEDKFKALLSNTTKGAQREIKDGFSSLPKGCYIQLEMKARSYILENIRSAFGQRGGLINRIATFEEDTGKKISIGTFLEYYHLNIKEIYAKDSFSRLCVYAGVKDNFTDPDEVIIKKAFSRICYIDSRRWIRFLLSVLPGIENIDETELTAVQKKMLLMFHYTVWQKPVAECGFKNIKDSIAKLKRNPILFIELIELLQYCYNSIDFVDLEVKLEYDSPLDLHCTYTRDQILTAVDYYTAVQMPSMREGVKYLPDKNMDIFLITLNKAAKDYSPSTMYNDYSINDYLFHWQSQSTTSEDSPTGKRYINHKRMKSQILLFVREFKTDVVGTAPYTFLGLADYVKHDGSRPMNIIWRLHKEIPAKFIKKTNKLITG